MTGLRVAKGVELSDDYVTKVAAIIAQRRKGKTYTASVIVEELIAAKLPVLVVDPTGAWWGLRASADGKKPGLPVTILGGAHGDVPIDRHSGTVVADLVVDHPSWYVCDLSLFDSHEAERGFVKALVERLYRRKGQPGMDFALHVVVDEADLYAPEQPLPGDQQMLGAFKTMVKRGGIRGIGVTVITQRPASLSKHVLEQADLLVLLRIVGPNDRNAVDRYVKANAEGSQRDDMMRSLPSLRLGEAWLWEPGGEPPLFERTQIRERRTFNSSATPKPGETLVEPQLLAEVDLDIVKDKLAEIMARAESENPERLRAEIADLQRQLRHLEEQNEQLRASSDVAQIDRLVAPTELFTAACDTEDTIVQTLTVVDEHSSEAVELIAGYFTEISGRLERIRASLRSAVDTIGNLPTRSVADFDGGDPLERRATSKRHDETVHVRGGQMAPLSPEYSERLRRGRGSSERSYDEQLLDTLAWFATTGVEEVERHVLALFADVSPRSSSYGKALARLVNDTLVDYPTPGYVMLTESGARRATPHAPITSNEELHEELARRLPPAQAKIIVALVHHHRGMISRADLATLSGQSASSSSYGKALAGLASYGLIEYPQPGYVGPVVDRLWPLP